jgi:hypothetical protein
MLPIQYEYTDQVQAERRAVAEHERRCRRLLAAKRWQRRAELTARRARMAQTSVW